MNIAKYASCGHCGFEETNVDVAYSRTCANGDFYICPACGEEIWNVEFED